MQRRRLQPTAIALLTLALCSGAAQQRYELFAVPAGAFLQDVSFAPDGRSVYATLVDGDARTVVVATRDSNGWSAPTAAPFSGRWRDLEEVVSPDGSTIVFASNRPADGSSRPIDAFFGGKARPGRGGNLWEVTQSTSGWTAPVRLGDAVNANTATFSPALTKDGTLYFMRASGPKLTFHIFVAEPEGGAYKHSALAPFSDERYTDFDPTVAPDGSFVIFGSNRPPSKPNTADLFITFHRGSDWTEPRDIGPQTDPDGDAIEPRLSPDASSLYYTAGTPPELRSVDIGSVTAANKP